MRKHVQRSAGLVRPPNKRFPQSAVRNNRPAARGAQLKRTDIRHRQALPRRRPLDLRWDAIVPEDRERFLRQFAAYLDSRWIDDPSETRADTRRQAVLAAVLAVVLMVVLAYLQRTGLIESPLRLP
jgi:hypothetical protein